MARKKAYVSKITTKDSQMLKAFARTGYLSKDMLRNSLGVAERRIQAFLRDKLIKKGTFFNPKNRSTSEVYTLTKKGQKLITGRLGIDRFYKSSSVAHDLGLSEKYLSLSKSEQESWIIESQIRDMFEEMLSDMRYDEHQEKLRDMFYEKKVSAIDACYTADNGQQVGIEITTSSYGDAEISAKEDFSNSLGIETQYIRI